MKKSFTLIEILIVIAIIAILASVVFISLNSGKNRAKNARAMSDLHALKVALQLYYDAHGEVPRNVYNGRSCKIGITPNPYNNNKPCLQELVDEGYLSSLPKGPENKCPESCGLTESEGSVCTKNCYFYYRYLRHVMLKYETTPQQYGPFPCGWNCSEVAVNNSAECGGWWPTMSYTPGTEKRYCDGFSNI